jgi:hypothetical protein
MLLLLLLQLPVCNAPSLPHATKRRRGAPALLVERRVQLAAADTNDPAVASEDVDLEDEVERFMKRQAEIESGGAPSCT